MVLQMGTRDGQAVRAASTKAGPRLAGRALAVGQCAGARGAHSLFGESPLLCLELPQRVLGCVGTGLSLTPCAKGCTGSWSQSPSCSGLFSGLVLVPSSHSMLLSDIFMKHQNT